MDKLEGISFGVCSQAIQVEEGHAACGGGLSAHRKPHAGPRTQHLAPRTDYFLFSHSSDTGIIQIFIDLLFSESIADWISIRVPSGLNVGWG